MKTIARTLVCLSLLWPSFAASEPARKTPGFPEEVLQWTVEAGETCRQIAETLYGNASRIALLKRYNAIDCDAPLTQGAVLVVPVQDVELPPARLNASRPVVKVRPAQGTWQSAVDGMPLHRGHGVNTLKGAQADILFRDRSHMFLGEQTLVIIYGTAEDTRESSARVQLDEGELRAGLVALGSDAWQLQTNDGGRVSANSRDVVVRRGVDSTSVSVFDGDARVEAAGRAVVVPKHYGTRYKKAAAPEPPRKLPEAPKWAGLPPESQLFAAGGHMRISWQPVASAVAYRVELATDEAFTRLIAREEVPQSVHAFAAQDLPAGAYYARVQAVDDAELLGLPSQILRWSVLQAKVALGTLERDRLLLSDYGHVDIEGPATARIRLDEDKHWQALPLRVSPIGRVLHRLHVVDSDGRIQHSYTVQRRALQPSMVATWSGPERVHLVVSGERLEAEAEAAGLQAWVSQGAGSVHYVLPYGAPQLQLDFAVNPRLPVDIELRDVRGVRLAALTLAVPRGRLQESELAPSYLGPALGFLGTTPRASTPLWAPRIKSQVATGATLAAGGGGPLGHVRAAATLGDFGLTARMASELHAGASRADSDSAAAIALLAAMTPAAGQELGARVAALLPLRDSALPGRFEVGGAWGTRGDAFEWLVNLNLRVAFAPFAGSTFHPYGALGAGYEAWGLQFHSWTEAAWFSDRQHARAALLSGVTVGDDWFAVLQLRASPWTDYGGRIAGMLGLGWRDW